MPGSSSARGGRDPFVAHGSAASRREGQVALVERLIPEYVSRIGWPVGRLEEERTAALRALLTAAVARSPWHRQRLEGLDAGSMSVGDLAELPVVERLTR